MDSTAYYVGAAYYGPTGKHYMENDVSEDYGRHKRSSFVNTEQNASTALEETEYRILCHAARIGSVIGKGGSVIKGPRQECYSKIKVEDSVPGFDERVIFISSVSTKHRDQTSICPAQEALLKVYSTIVHGLHEDDDEPQQPVTVRLLVPHGQIGCLIGKGGRIIEQMRKETGTQIRILPKEQLLACALSDDELVQIAGEPALVKKALFSISTRLHDSPPHERMDGSRLLGASNVCGVDGMYPSSGYMAQASTFLTPASMGGLMSGFGGYCYPSFGAHYGAAIGSAWPVSLGMLMASKQQNDGSPEDELSICVLCPNVKIGSMIGKGGVVVKKMREETGAKIKIDDPISDSDERVIHILASEYMESYVSPVIEATHQVVKRLIELQMEKDKDNKSFTVRLLVPSSLIGCLLGKGGAVITEMRKVTKANIRIPPKEELPKCAGENDELVQIMGDEVVIQDAVVHVLNRLRNNLFNGREGTGKFITPMSGFSFSGGAMFPSYGARYDLGSAGIYSFTNMGEYGFGGYFGGGPHASLAGSTKKPRHK